MGIPLGYLLANLHCFVAIDEYLERCKEILTKGVGFMDMKPIKSLDSLDNITMLAKAMSQHLEQEQTKKFIKQKADETLEYLIKNTSHYGIDGDEIDKPWFFPLPNSEDKTLLLNRQRGLEDQIWGHGWRHYLAELTQYSVIPEQEDHKLYNLINETNLRPMIQELVTDHKTDGEVKQLNPLARRFGISPTKFRNNQFVQMIGHGFFKARYKEGWGVTIGIIPLTFMDEVYTPAYIKFSELLGGKV